MSTSFWHGCRFTNCCALLSSGKLLFHACLLCAYHQCISPLITLVGLRHPALTTACVVVMRRLCCHWMRMNDCSAYRWHSSVLIWVMSLPPCLSTHGKLCTLHSSNCMPLQVWPANCCIGSSMHNTAVVCVLEDTVVVLQSLYTVSMQSGMQG